MNKSKKLIIGVVSLMFCLPVLSQSMKTRVCRAQALPGTVALTFDDGPSATDTQKVLSILEQNHINATFFVVGEKVRENPQYLKQMIADGDVIGDHTMTHPQIPKVNDQQLYNEVVASKNLIYQVIGQNPKLFRFPYGAENERVRQYVLSQGMVPVFWDNCPRDYQSPGANVIAERVISEARSGQVILLHDGPGKRPQTVEALPKIIDGIRKKGLGFSVLCS